MTATYRVNATRSAGDLSEKCVCAVLAAIAADADQRLRVALGAVGGAGVGGERHQIAEIASVTHRAFDALVGHDPGDDQRAQRRKSQDESCSGPRLTCPLPATVR